MSTEKKIVDPKAPKAAKKPRKPAGPVVTVIPEFRGKDGALLKLKGRMFPKTKDGKIAFCDYQIARWQSKKDSIAAKSDPATKAIRKIAALKAKLALLEEEAAKEKAALETPTA